MINFSIVIPTKNRLEDLKITLSKLEYLINDKNIETIILDDGSNDGTKDYILENYKNIRFYRNEKSKGILAVRNKLFSLVNTEYAISIDDDANFLTGQILESIEKYFKENTKTGLLYFRSYWSKEKPSSTETTLIPHRTQSFGAVAFAIKMSVWKSIPNLLEWFLFYGEENFISYELFKVKKEIHYLPTILVHHRVDIKSRKKEKDYRLRQRRSFRSGWYLYLLFYPLKEIPRRLVYTLWQQIKIKTLKGDFKATIGVFQAVLDVVYNFPKLVKNANRLTVKEFKEYQKLPSTKLYWKPEK
ncbi:glycosyltransferase family A protein [Polaribacter undariae]|uniref:Glycosyltransferase family A protein n=1 Tax=Polaribacter sejongensis TaxID=985043 RepID=A0AAJ1VFU6_9FLAO|nr:glycosyltransferase family A protein [Polaribacter undariae]MDN3618941.1 glycosyltransferase family A protein [Polaribacter undariae]UWD33030.1 glycosyltransferase family 2 protein [Polaribacter undariae]